MNRVSQFLIVVIVSTLLILGLLPSVFLQGNTEYAYSDERAVSEIVTIRDNNGTLSTLSHPETYGPGAFNITLTTTSWYNPIAINESVSEVRVDGFYYSEIPFGQGGLVKITSGADLYIIAGNALLRKTYPEYYMIGQGGGGQWIGFSLTLNRTFLDMSNASGLSVIFECTAAAESNYTYFVNYGISLFVDLRYKYEIRSSNPLPRVSVMTLGLCSVILLVFESASSKKMEVSS